MNQSIEIHIEELVLHGFSPHDRHRISDAIQQALHQHLSNMGIPANLSQGQFIEQIDAGVINYHPSSKPQIVGASIGETVYNGLSNED